MFRHHLVANKVIPVFEQSRFRPNGVRLRMLRIGQMDDRETIGAIKKAEKNIVAVLATTDCNDWNAKQDVLSAKLAM